MYFCNRYKEPWNGQMDRDNVGWRSWEVTRLLGVHGALALFPSKRQWTCCGQAKVTPHWRERMQRVSWKRQTEETEASRHWFLTSLTRRPFNIAPRAVVNLNPKVTPVLEFHNSIFAIIMNRNLSIWCAEYLLCHPWERVVRPSPRGCDLQAEDYGSNGSLKNEPTYKWP